MEKQSIDMAFDELDDAMKRLETTVDVFLETNMESPDFHVQLQHMSTDRSHLAEKLDLASARTALMEETNRDVSRRLVSAMESIRTVLERRTSN